MRRWHHQLHSFAYSYRLVKKMFLEIVQTSKCHNFLIFEPIFIRFSTILFKMFTLSSEFKLNLFWISSLRGRHISKTEPARPLCELKSAFFARMTAGVCSITAGSAAIFRDRPAFAGHRNLFLIQRFSNGRISDLRNMTCTNFRCPIYANARQDVGLSPPERRPGVGRASTDLLITDRNSEGAHPYIDRASHDSR